MAKTIVESGNEDYYRYREEPDGATGPARLPDFLDKLIVYDNPDVQKSFVRQHNDGTKEAFLILEDIRCAACVWLNEQQLRKIAGVLDVKVDYTSHQARVCWDPQQVQLSEILLVIASIGYKAHPFDPTQREKLIQEQKHKSVSRLLFSGLLGMAVMGRAVAGYWMGGVDAQGHLELWEVIGRWTDLFIVTIMLAYSGISFYISAWRDLKNHHLGMDLPIVIGLTTAYVGSFIATLQQAHDVYYDSIAMFIFLMLAARYYELQGRLLAAASLDRLLKVIPKTCYRLRGNKLEEVLITELVIGDQVQINPGDTVPVDGRLVQGQSSFDESLLTGEMMPVMYSPGAYLISGSCNVDQSVVMEVERTVMNSTLTDIHSLLEKGIQSRPRYALIAERSAKWFVSAILIIASMTALFWSVKDPAMALPVTIAVLIVTCPCALALATPVALSLSSGLFAQMGVLPLKMSAIEDLSQSDTVVFDKTGTLTVGQPELKQIVLTDRSRLDEADYHQIASSLEWFSEHPIAKTFKLEGEEASFVVKDLKNQPGLGISGEINGHQWKIGKLSFCMDEPTLALEVSLQSQIYQARQMGNIVIGLSKDKQLECVFFLHDPLREGGYEMVQDLFLQGIKKVVILSGDHPESVARVAGQLGITEFHGNMKPEDKLAWIQTQQAQQHHVIMVGDGINDAPTLAAANVSISFTDATDLAQINSDFVIMGQHINVIPELRKLSRKSRKIIIQNLSWAAAYNFMAVPFAVLGWIPPWGAALGMSLSSFLVISNSLRLKERAGKKNVEEQG